MAQKTHEQFVKELNDKLPHLEVLGKYCNGNTKITLKCTIHNYSWDILPRSILSGANCPYCNGHNKRHEDFAQEIFDLNPDIIILSKYTNNHERINYSCSKCNKSFSQRPMNLLRNPSCPFCRDRKRRTTEDFKEELLQNNPDVTLCGEFKNFQTKIQVQCNKCGYNWDALPQNILKGHACPKCNQSLGERKIIEILDKLKIDYNYEYPFSDCIDKFVLPFDFYLPQYHMCIEYDGIQHFQAVEHFGGEEQLKIQQRHDKIKNDYCNNNHIDLLRIKYTDFNKIEDIINDKLSIM